MSARISILMPCYNAAPFLREAIESILNQTYPGFELLIADDGSTDGSAAILDSFRDRRIRRLEPPAHLGYLKVSQFLFSNVSSEFFAFQDADDVSERLRLERQLEVFEKNPGVHLCTTDYHRTNIDGSIRLTRRWPTDYEAIRRDLSQKLRICKSSIMARTAILQTFPGYREFFDGMGGEDIDWVYRVIEKHSAVHLPEVLYRYRVHYSSCKAAHASRAVYYVMDIVETLRRQRLETGTDWLETGNREELRKKIAECEFPFREDPSYIHRLRAGDMIRFREFVRAMQHSAIAILRRPLIAENYRNFAQSLSTIVTSSLKGSQ